MSIGIFMPRMVTGSSKYYYVTTPYTDKGGRTFEGYDKGAKKPNLAGAYIDAGEAVYLNLEAGRGIKIHTSQDQIISCDLRLLREDGSTEYVFSENISTLYFDPYGGYYSVLMPLAGGHFSGELDIEYPLGIKITPEDLIDFVSPVYFNLITLGLWEPNREPQLESLMVIEVFNSLLGREAPEKYMNNLREYSSYPMPDGEGGIVNVPPEELPLALNEAYYYMMDEWYNEGAPEAPTQFLENLADEVNQNFEIFTFSIGIPKQIFEKE